MMKGLVLATLLAISGTALANENEKPLVGFYAGGGGGEAVIDDRNFNANDTSFKVFGGFRLDKYYGIELGYLDNGDVEDTNKGVKKTISSTAFEITALGFYPFNDTFTVFGKLGSLSSDFDTKTKSALGNTSLRNQSDDSLLYGVGLLINLPKRTSIRLEVEASEIKDSDIWIATLSGIYRFKI